MLVVIPAFTLLLATAAERPRARRRRRLAPPDLRWLDLQGHATDLFIWGVDDDFIAFILELSERSGVPPLLGGNAARTMERRLARAVPGATLDVDPESGFWSIRFDDWLLKTEPWCTSCLIGSGHPPPIPPFTGQRLPLYLLEARRRRMAHEGSSVPHEATHLVTEIWLPATHLRPNPMGLDYDAVQLTLWKLRGTQ
jgi:hypothetical protein